MSISVSSFFLFLAPSVKRTAIFQLKIEGFPVQPRFDIHGRSEKTAATVTPETLTVGPPTKIYWFNG